MPITTIRYHLIGLLEGPHAQERDRWLIAAEAVDGNELRDGNGPQRRTPLLAAALWMQGDVAAAEARLAEIESKFGGPPPEVPAPLRGVRVTSIGSSAPPEGWPHHAFDAFATRLREGIAQYPEGPPEDWCPRPTVPQEPPS